MFASQEANQTFPHMLTYRTKRVQFHLSSKMSLPPDSNFPDRSFPSYLFCPTMVMLSSYTIIY